jgi:cell division protein FtsW
VTILLDPRPARLPGTPSVADRRRAALERLQGTAPATRDRVPTATRRPARAGLPVPRPTRTARARSNATSTAPDTAVVAPLGPPPVAYYVIAVVVAVFVMLGLVMVLSSSAPVQIARDQSAYRIFGRQVMWALLGFVGLLVAVKVPYQRWRPFVLALAVLAAGAMALPFVPGVGATINDARSWVVLGPVSFQPSEVLKITMLALAADLLARRGERVAECRQGVVPLVLIAGFGAGACLAQGDLGSALVLGAIVVAVGFIAGVPLVHLAVVTLAGSALMTMFVVSSPRRFNRFTAFLDVAGNKDYLSYQTYQGWLSMANGGMTGAGIGGSNGKLGYLPLAHSDFIFAIIGEELGLVGAIGVIGGFLILVWFGVQTALAAPDRFGMLLAGGIATWFGVQAFVNLGGVSGVLPVTGLTLPFFSAGGTSLFVSLVAVGLLLNVARRAR